MSFVSFAFRGVREGTRQYCPLCDGVSGSGAVCAFCDAALDRARLVSADFTVGSPERALRCHAVFSYEYEAVVRLLFFLKNDPDRAVVRYAAMRLAGVLAGSDEQGTTLLVPVPRSPKGMREHGFDQGALIAEQTARFLKHPLESRANATKRHVAYAPLVAVRPFVREQKRLTDAERAENRANSFYIRPFSRPKKDVRRIVIVDDMITTGASVLACADALRSLYPKAALSALSLASEHTKKEEVTFGHTERI